jgi:Type VI immunity for VRR-NUC
MTLPYVLDRFKGANWLTLIGSALAGRVRSVPASEVEVIKVGRGLVLHAGPAPRLGDRNRMDWPMGMASVERALVSIKIESHPEFTGIFAAEKATWPWLNRFLDLDGW